MEPISGALMGPALLKDRLSILKAAWHKERQAGRIYLSRFVGEERYKRYRCYIDDHSFCFRDILQKQYKAFSTASISRNSANSTNATKRRSS